MKFVVLAALVLAARVDAATKGCLAGSTPVTTIQLLVQPPTGPPMGVPLVNVLRPGYKIQYKPVTLPTDIRREARVALMIAPAEGEPTGTSALTVLDAAPAATPFEWTLPYRASIVTLIFAPQGLDEKKVANVAAREEDTIGQLADYASRTAELEATFRELTALDDEEDDAETRLGSTPVEQALLALLRAQNPAFATFNPLAAGRRAPTVGMMGRATDAFFDGAGAVVPGGGVLPGVKGFFFPETELRSTFAQPGDDGLTLCGQRRQVRARTKVAYLWAHRTFDGAAPQATLGDVNVLAKMRSTLPVKLATAAQWDAIDHVRDWALTPAAGGTAIPVPVRLTPHTRGVTLDLRKAEVAPGAYKLTSKWDWEDLTAAGTITVHATPDLSGAKVDAASQDRLVEGLGVVPVRLTGTDFQFVEKVALQTVQATPLDFKLAKGRRGGVQPALDTAIDLGDLRAGQYNLMLTQAGGSVTSVEMRVLAVPPRLDALPLKLTIGEAGQTVTLRGVGLDRIARVESAGAEFELRPAAKDAVTREAVVKLAPASKAGDRLALALRVDGMSQPVAVEGAVVVSGPRPKLALLKSSVAADLPTALRQGELPAGSWAGFQLSVENAPSRLELRCAGAASASMTIAPGSRGAQGILDHPAAGRWYASVDPGSIGGTGCVVEARATSEAGASDPVKLGTIVRLPVVEDARLVGDRVELRGRDLDVIERVGWSAEGPIAVEGLPVPLAGQGPRQVLRTALIAALDPSLPLHVWLWGESAPRATRVTLTPGAAPAKP